MDLRLMSILFMVLRASSAANPPVVTTNQGRITGTTLQLDLVNQLELHRSVDAYLGIPYAEPPVGPLRFRPPVAKSWSGELKATELGNRCPQITVPVGKLDINGPFSEDCLSLDVFVPRPVPPKAAVLVLIHGGGFVLGAGAIRGMYPTQLVAVGDVIVVDFNYRLGSLGFLSTNDDVIPGNMGLLDQRLALEWVRDNIQAFGGDPGRVAVFGMSAGSACVGLHMLSPGSAGLFHGGIMQSGVATADWATLPGEVIRRRTFAFGKLVGCEQETSQELLECLQKVEDGNIFVENQHHKLNQALGVPEFTFFYPVADGNFLPGEVSDLYEKGAINDVASIIGANADEGMFTISTFFPNITEAPFIDANVYDVLQSMCTNAISPHAIVSKAVKMMYTDASCTTPSCNHLESLSQVCGDVMFGCPADAAARAHTKAGRKVYRYHMSYDPSVSALGLGAWTKCSHGDEGLFILGVPLLRSEEKKFPDEEVRMSQDMIRFWTNFAKTGNPNLSSLDDELTDEEKKTEWALFTLEDLAYKDLTPDMLNGRGIKAKECRFWNEFIPELIKTAENAQKGQGMNSNKWTQDGGPGGETCTEDSCPGE